jgi:hypothetical protein
MVKKKLCLMLVLMIFMAMRVQGLERLSRSGNWAKHPVITILTNGDILCLWGEGAEERIADICYRILNRQTGKWGDKKIAAHHVYAAVFPQIVQDCEGVVHMAYMDGNSRSNRDIWYTAFDYRKPEGQQWATPSMILRTSEQSAWQRIAIDPQREDLYVSWQHVYKDNPNSPEGWHSNIVVVQKSKDLETGEYGLWSEPVKLSRNVEDISIHQDTIFVDGKLHGVYEEGKDNDKADWILRHNFLEGGIGFGEAAKETVVEIPGASPPSYWCELAVDSQQNLYLVYSRRTTETMAAFKSVDGSWQDLGSLYTGSVITMIGLTVAKNDVAYVIHNQGTSGKIRPVFVRFTDKVKMPPVPVTDYQDVQENKTLEIEVDDEGTAHCVWTVQVGSDRARLDVWHHKVHQSTDGPEVALSVDPPTVLTNEDITFTGTVLNSATPIVNHRFYIKSSEFWGGRRPFNYQPVLQTGIVSGSLLRGRQ